MIVHILSPMFINSNNLQVYTEATNSYLQEWMRSTANDSTLTYQINYSYTTGTNRGSGMVDTRLNGKVIINKDL